MDTCGQDPARGWPGSTTHYIHGPRRVARESDRPALIVGTDAPPVLGPALAVFPPTIRARASPEPMIGQSPAAGCCDAGGQGVIKCRSMVWRIRLAVGVAAVAIALMAGAGAAQAFSARGSVEQVYVTQLGPGAQMSLLNRQGGTIATKRADAQGGLLFRNVKPGTGY